MALTCCCARLPRGDDEGEGKGPELEGVPVAFARTGIFGGGIISPDGVGAAAAAATEDVGRLAWLLCLTGGQLEPVLRVFRKGPTTYLGGCLRGEDDGG